MLWASSYPAYGNFALSAGISTERSFAGFESTADKMNVAASLRVMMKAKDVKSAAVASEQHAIIEAK
jgi:hypothetical protein